MDALVFMTIYATARCNKVKTRSRMFDLRLVELKSFMFGAKSMLSQWIEKILKLKLDRKNIFLSRSMAQRTPTEATMILIGL